MSSDAQIIKDRFRRCATRFYLINAAVLLVLAAVLYAASEPNYKTVFISVTVLFLVWLFNAGRLLRCPACNQVVRSSEGLIRMPQTCDGCGVALR